MMNFLQIATTAYITASISFVTLFGIAFNQGKSNVTLLDNGSVEVEVETDDYLNLIDGKINSLDERKYTIRRRYSSIPVDSEMGEDLYLLYLDIYNQQGNVIGTRTHNLPVSKAQ